MNLFRVPITSRQTNIRKETFHTESHKILVCTARCRCKKTHELCFRYPLFLFKGATLRIVTVQCPKEGHHHSSWCLPHNPLTLSSSISTTVPLSIRNLHAGSIGHATNTFGRRPVRISAWTEFTLIFSVSPRKFRDGTSNYARLSQFQIQPSHNWTAPSFSHKQRR